MSSSQLFLAIDHCFILINALLESKMKVVSSKSSEFGEMRGGIKVRRQKEKMSNLTA